jgi:hypothetical protein
VIPTWVLLVVPAFCAGFIVGRLTGILGLGRDILRGIEKLEGKR